jgi:hypothetical protein
VDSNARCCLFSDILTFDRSSRPELALPARLETSCTKNRLKARERKAVRGEGGFELTLCVVPKSLNLRRFWAVLTEQPRFTAAKGLALL